MIAPDRLDGTRFFRLYRPSDANPGPKGHKAIRNSEVRPLGATDRVSTQPQPFADLGECWIVQPHKCEALPISKGLRSVVA